MRRLGVWVMAAAALGAVGCDESSEPMMTGDGGSDGGGGSGGGSNIRYPDSLCNDEACTKNGEEAGVVCDGDGQDEALPDCNAWAIDGQFALQAVEVGDGTLGRPEAPTKADGDNCPELMTRPDGISDGEQHCCQRTDNSDVAMPAFKLTGLVLSSPLIFAQDAVTVTNVTAIAEDRYNWMMVLDQKPAEDATEAEVTVISGTAVHNTDGSFNLVDGTFQSNGVTFNEDGHWDPHQLPGTFTKNDDGTWHLSVNPWVSDRPISVPIWSDKDIDFVSMDLGMNGVQMDIDIEPSFNCGGMYDEFGEFELPGTLRGYLPIDRLQKTCLILKSGGTCEEDGTPMCEFTAGVKDCGAPRTEWVSRAGG